MNDDINESKEKLLELLKSENRALTKQNENLHKRIEHLQEELMKAYKIIKDKK